MAKQGANLFVDLLGVGDSLGVASFDCGVSVDFPLTNITGDATRSAAKSAINSLSADGATNIGGGLQTALDQITSQTDESCNEIIVLLTDGDHNCGTDPNSVIPALQDRGVTVLTIGVGTSISTSGQALLQSIGSQTAGKFYRVANPSDQVAVFFQLSTETTGSGLLTRSPETLTAGQTKEIAVLLETGAESAIFGIGLADSSDQFTLSLKTPSGALITQADAGHPGIEFISESNSRAFRISNPEAGVWKIVVTAGTVTNGKVEAFASAKHDGVQLNLSVTNDALVFPEAAEVHATPTFGGQSVVGATVNGFVVRPDGSTIAITLFDDGTSGHADAVAEDGIYAARFSKYNQNGTYSFTLTALNINGVTYAGENLFAAEQSNESPVTPFTRTSSITAVVTGIPANATDLSISKSASGSPVVSGSNITYTLIVKNNGPNVATSVAITDSLPATTTFASCTATGGGICGGSGNNRTVTFASLDVGASATITLAATVNCSVADGTLINNSATAVSTEPELDPSDNSAEVAFTASNPPPVITGAAASPSELWPPNHKMVNVTISYNVTDNCPLPANACTLSVSSNEPVDGTGDGDTAPDWMVVNTNHVQLRAERAGTGNDRIYTITITCRDSASSSSSQSVTVRVPNNR